MRPGEIIFTTPIPMGAAAAAQIEEPDRWFVIGPSGAIVEAGPAIDREAARIAAQEKRLADLREAERQEAQLEIERAEAYQRARDAEYETMRRRALGLPDA